MVGNSREKSTPGNGTFEMAVKKCSLVLAVEREKPSCEENGSLTVRWGKRERMQ